MEYTSKKKDNYEIIPTNEWSSSVEIIEDVNVITRKSDHEYGEVGTNMLEERTLKIMVVPEYGAMVFNKGSDNQNLPLSTLHDDPCIETSGWRNVAVRKKILKTIVSDGVTESMASLSIVTSAVNVNISNGNMVALGFTNIIAGFFVIRHNLAGLKKKKVKKGPNGEVVRQVKEALGDTLHYLLHFTMAVLSFLLFGLVPPLVYGLSFHESGDKDLKLRAAAAASLLCITVLAIARAHIQKPENWLLYAKYVLYYASVGVLALALSYFAAQISGNFIDKHGSWFE